jgi:rod shape determining protein RodA
VAVGLAAVALTVLIDYTQLKFYANWIYGLNLLLLGAVLFTGKVVKGARSWISLGPARFQPSEFSKLMLIVALAAYVSERDGELNSWWDILKTGLYVLPPFVLVLAQPDLGTAMVFAAIWLGVLFVGGAALRKLLALVCGSFGLVVASVVAHLHWGLPLPLKEHQLMRLIVFASPGVDRTGAGY